MSILPAAVVIGRNEGERLLRCLDSLQGHADPIVYVDSGSTDGSLAAAHARGVVAVQLDLSQPFTAARARNAGCAEIRLRGVDEQRAYVQFVDGDCEVQADWWTPALEFLDAHPDVAVVCGRRRERWPERSIYNRLCDLEWNTPVGEARACGGDALMRLAALDAVGGYRDSLIAGEEPELCLRLRSAGWKIYRLNVEMTLHDAAMTRFMQWFRRSQRAGHAFAEGATLHGAAPHHHYVRETRRALIWGLALPICVLAGSVLDLRALWLLLLYPLQYGRLAIRSRRPLQSLFLVIGKFAEAAGVLTYYQRRLFARTPRLIEYK